MVTPHNGFIMFEHAYCRLLRLHNLMWAVKPQFVLPFSGCLCRGRCGVFMTIINFEVTGNSTHRFRGNNPASLTMRMRPSINTHSKHSIFSAPYIKSLLKHLMLLKCVASPGDHSFFMQSKTEQNNCIWYFLLFFIIILLLLFIFTCFQMSYVMYVFAHLCKNKVRWKIALNSNHFILLVKPYMHNWHDATKGKNIT